MTINISQHILGLKGQRVNEIKLDEGSINQHVRRQVNDIPLFGYPCVVEIELAQVYINKGERRIEGCDFVDKGCRFTHRFCRLISGLCRHMSIQAVSRHLDIRWETVKNIDRAYLIETLPTLDPAELTGLEYIGVDEVAR
ncbi:helix-turn-helix domain-containing protein, partial [Kiloniella sp.]|uniref:helix-turn-helix domain-containing protein n=1 Tax=Kiloniella sp. TaxID=1938587 RepID=UPI003B011434